VREVGGNITVKLGQSGETMSGLRSQPTNIRMRRATCLSRSDPAVLLYVAGISMSRNVLSGNNESMKAFLEIMIAGGVTGL